MNITIASYNIHKCVGMDKKFNPSRINEVITELNPDIIALQEVDKRFGTRRGLLDLGALERQLGLVAVPIDTIKSASHGWHGNLLLYRFLHLIHYEQIKLPSAEPRGAILAKFLLPNKQILQIIAAHLGLLKKSRELQVAALLEHIKKTPNATTIFLGDLNEWRTGNNSSLKPLEEYFGNTHKPVNSFPAKRPLLPLDKILTSNPRLLKDIAIHKTDLAKMASDHLPIKAQFTVS